MSQILKNYYDPKTRKVHLAPNATLFSAFHEYAHAEQHEKRTMLFCLWLVLHNLRVLGYVVTVLIEWDANRRAQNAMIANGIWTDEACEQAWEGLKSYLLGRNPDA